MTRKTQFGLTAAAALLGLGLVTTLWLTHGKDAPPDDTPPRAHTTPAAGASDAAPNEDPTDPQVLALTRAAYQQHLADGAPPGMVELMQGPGAGQPGAPDLPPLPDPFVAPARYDPEPVSPGGLPPLPADWQRPLWLTPWAWPAPKSAGAPADLPPLPPPGKPGDK